MFQFVSILVIVVSVLLILIVLVQDSKSGGLASNFSASNQIMGVRKTTDFLGKATWYLAGGLLVLSLVTVMILNKSVNKADTEFDEKVEQIAEPQNAMPTFPSADAAQGAEEGTATEGQK